MTLCGTSACMHKLHCMVSLTHPVQRSLYIGACMHACIQPACCRLNIAIQIQSTSRHSRQQLGCHTCSGRGWTQLRPQQLLAHFFSFLFSLQNFQAPLLLLPLPFLLLQPFVLLPLHRQLLGICFLLLFAALVCTTNHLELRACIHSASLV